MVWKAIWFRQLPHYLIAFLIFMGLSHGSIDPSSAFSHIGNMNRLIIFVLLVVASTSAQAQSLAGSEWGLGDGDPRYLKFGAGGKLSGDAGCNNFMAEYSRTSSRLHIGPVATTRKLCPPEQMKLEEEWLGILKRVRSYEVDHLKLKLYGPKRIVLAVLKRRDWD